MEIILASASERRHELLRRLTENFRIIVSSFDEDTVPFEGDCGEYVKKLSRCKALEVAGRVTEDSLIIGCDTIVAFGDRVLGKPKDREDAFRMLKMLSGSRHQVYSGITLYDTRLKRHISDYVMTEVQFSPLEDREILKYIDTGEPMDKAGSYGIQGHGGVFVEGIQGCYYNVVGLPINKLNFMLRGMGVNL